MRKLERKNIDVFELWCWIRLLRITWIDRKTNVWVIGNIKPEWTLESRIVKASLCYFGHVIRAGGMEYEVMVGRWGVIKAEGDHGKYGLIELLWNYLQYDSSLNM